MAFIELELDLLDDDPLELLSRSEATLRALLLTLADWLSVYEAGYLLLPKSSSGSSFS